MSDDLFERVEFHIRGLSPHLQSNGQMADPLNKFAKALKEYTSKQKKTDADHRAIADVEWEGGLYVDEHGRPCVPGTVIEGAIWEAAKLVRQGPKVRAGVSSDENWPLIYDGPKSLDKLRADPNFRDRRMVTNKGGGGKVPRTRPRFATWELKFAVELRNDIISRDVVIHLVSLLGNRIGLSDDRRKAGGRFEILSVDGKPYDPNADRDSQVNGKASKRILEKSAAG
jgi:hypothetical protein